MKILSVSDQIEERLYSPLLKQSFQDIDLIVGCGDLPYPYLEFLLCILNVPLLYVPGNHDPQRVENNAKTRVEGGINLDLKTVKIKGLIFAGIGGSIQYRPDGVNQIYTIPNGLAHTPTDISSLMEPRPLWKSDGYSGYPFPSRGYS
jgi:hypothetical protein